MAYIGNSPANVGNYQIIDSIASSFNGSSTSFALASLGTTITPAKSGQLLIGLNGVMQQPDDTGANGFKVSGSNIVFSSAPASGDSFWGVYQGQQVDVGVPSNDTIDTVHIKNNAITADKIAAGAVVADIATGGITTAKIADDAVTADKLANSINTDINTGVAGNTTANAALPKSGGAMTGAITTNSTFDSRNVSTDGTKLDGIAANANNYVHPNHSGDVVSAADGAMTIQTDAVDIAMLSATGTPGNTTFLRGDNAWATAGSTSASDLTSGTLPMARLSGTLPALNGSALTNLPSDVTVSATVPSSPSEGDLWFNSSASTVSTILTKAMAVYNGSSWKSLTDVPVQASGGTEATYSGYKSHTFLSSGNFVVSSGGTVEILIIAGGGAGSNWHGGGGGAGGMQLYNTTATEQTYSIVVGAGGAGGTTSLGSNGANSSAFGITSLGGGRGGFYSTTVAASGGSGAGGNGETGYLNGAAGTSGQGTAGGNGVTGHAGGGGGGKGAVGNTASSANSAGDGGNGATNNYRTGSNITYAGGGGGGTWGGSSAAAGGTGGGGNGSHSNNSYAPTAGTANTGGGGGGNGGQGNNTSWAAQTTGGSGIVVIRYSTL